MQALRQLTLHIRLGYTPGLLRTEDGALLRQSPPSVMPTRSAQCVMMMIVVRCVRTERPRQLSLDCVKAKWDKARLYAVSKVSHMMCLAHIDGVAIVLAVMRMITHGLHSNSTAGVDLSIGE